MKLIGLTLEIDGNPEEVQRIHDAITREYGAILRETFARDIADALCVPRYMVRPSCSLKGKLTLRQELAPAPDECSCIGIHHEWWCPNG